MWPDHRLRSRTIRAVAVLGALIINNTVNCNGGMPGCDGYSTNMTYLAAPIILLPTALREKTIIQFILGLRVLAPLSGYMQRNIIFIFI